MPSFAEGPKPAIFKYDGGDNSVNRFCEVLGFCPEDNDPLLKEVGFSDVAPCYVIKLNGMNAYALMDEITIVKPIIKMMG